MTAMLIIIDNRSNTDFNLLASLVSIIRHPASDWTLGFPDGANLSVRTED